MITAITKKNQKHVTKAVKALTKYNEVNDLRDIASNEGDDKAFRKYDNACNKAFDAYLEACEYLPKREINQIERLLY